MTLPKLGEKKILWETDCGNAIAEIGKFFFCTIVAMALPKMGGGKKIYRRVKKKSVISIIFLQYFHNRSHVISYY